MTNLRIRVFDKSSHKDLKMRVSDNTSFQAIVARTLILKTKAHILFFMYKATLLSVGCLYAKKSYG